MSKAITQQQGYVLYLGRFMVQSGERVRRMRARALADTQARARAPAMARPSAPPHQAVEEPPALPLELDEWTLAEHFPRKPGQRHTGWW